MFRRPLTDQEVLAQLPLSESQRQQIYNDFILAGKYDKKILPEMKDIEEKKEYVEEKKEH